MRSVGTMWIGIHKHLKIRVYRLKNAKQTNDDKHTKAKQAIIYLFSPHT